MTRIQLVEACGKAIAAKVDIALVIERPATGRRRVHLAGRCSPLGEVACENCDGHTVAHFDPLDVLAWLVTTSPRKVHLP